MSREALPETNKNIIIGHGSVTPEQILREKRIAKIARTVLPGVRRRSEAICAESIYSSCDQMSDYANSLHTFMRRNDCFKDKKGVRLHVEGLAGYGEPQYIFSEITAFAEPSTQTYWGEIERVKWSILIANQSNRTTSLITAQTSANPEITEIGSVQLHNPKTGKEYDEQDMTIHQTAELFDTLAHATDTLRWEVNNPSRLLTTSFYSLDTEQS